jgi:DNA topoisomerase-1
VRLLEKTLIRIGNDEYARTNHSYGLTTLRNHHVKVRGRKLAFDFRAKSGLLQHVDLEDPALARTVKTCQELPGQTLFEYVDAEGSVQRVESSDVNDYLREIAGREFTAKDFRTWAGTLLAACALSEVARPGAARSHTGRTRQVVAAIDRVARALGNTRSVCRKCYVHPAVLDLYLDGGATLPVPPASDDVVAARRLVGNSAAERALLAFLQALKRGTKPAVATRDNMRDGSAVSRKAAGGSPLATQRRGAGETRPEGATPWRTHPDSRNPRFRLSTRRVRASRRRSGPRPGSKRPRTGPQAS